MENQTSDRYQYSPNIQELAHIYEENGSTKCALELIKRSRVKVTKQYDLEKQDPPVPFYIIDIYENCLIALKSLELKYAVQSETIRVEDLKNRIETDFKDKKSKVRAAIEILKIINHKYSGIKHDGKGMAWKEGTFQLCLSLILEDLKTLCANLTMTFETIQLEMELNKDFREMNAEERKEKFKELRKKKLEIISITQIRSISNTIPLEYHLELIKCGFDIKNHSAFQELVQLAFTRCDYRRIEHPYITDIDFIVSDTPEANVDNGYERIRIDINEAAIRQEINNFRNKSIKTGPKANDDPSTDEPSIPVEDLVSEAGFAYTRAELNSINHRFVYLCVKRSYNPENAIFDIKVVVAHETTGPKNDELQDISKWTCKAIPINQYIGVQATYHTVPYLCFRQSETVLTYEEEKQTLLIDVIPMISKSPIVRPPQGYRKLDVDLRQVPKEFIKMANIEYMFLTVKMDIYYHNSNRMIRIYDAFFKLERSWNSKDRISTPEDEAKSMLLASYDHIEFSNLIEIAKQALEGPNGEKFLLDSFDFLVELSFYLWNKYVSPVLVQIEHFYYIRTMKELDSSFIEVFEEIIENRLKPCFLKCIRIFLKVASANDESIDIMWISKMSIQLSKLLEEACDYKIGYQILRNTWEKIVIFRDESILIKTESKHQLLLPFCLTCNNQKISKMINDMQTEYVNWKTALERKIRATVITHSNI